MNRAFDGELYLRVIVCPEGQVALWKVVMLVQCRHDDGVK